MEITVCYENGQGDKLIDIYNYFLYHHPLQMGSIISIGRKLNNENLLTNKYGSTEIIIYKLNFKSITESTKERFQSTYVLSNQIQQISQQTREKVLIPNYRQQEIKKGNCIHSEIHSKSNQDFIYGRKILKNSKQYQKNSQILTVLERQTQHISRSNILLQQFFIKLQINQHIFNVVDRNETYSSNYAHFLVMLNLILLELYTYSKNQQLYLMKVFHLVLKRLVKPHIKIQLQQKEFYKYLSFLVSWKKVNSVEVIDKMIQFMEAYKDILTSFCPYYYNLFALVINKETVFCGKDQKLIPYTVQYEHRRYYNNNFTRGNIYTELSQLQKLLVQKYHQQ